MASVSGHSGRFIFKICQTVAGIKYYQSISLLLWISFLAGFCYLAQFYASSDFQYPPQNWCDNQTWLDLTSLNLMGLDYHFEPNFTFLLWIDDFEVIFANFCVGVKRSFDSYIWKVLRIFELKFVKYIQIVLCEKNIFHHVLEELDCRLWYF
jgi:hypothetical protein